MRQNYEVMRLIRQNSDCHIIMDTVKGETLGEFVLRNPKVEKEQFFQWMIQIVKEMECIEKSKSMEEYRYLIPFNIILKEDKKIALLNLKTKSNQRRLKSLLSRPGIKQFFSEDGVCDDIYSYGKTVQFLLAKVDLYPELTKKEEKILKKIISKCLNYNSRKAYQNFSDIISEIPSAKSTETKKEKKKPVKRRVLFTILGIKILAIAAFAKIVLFPEIKSNENAEAYLEAGITYFNTLEDYEKSEALFEQARGEDLSEYYQAMAEYMQGKSKYTDLEMENLLDEFQEKFTYLEYEQKYSLLKVYDKISSDTAKEKVICLAEDILESPDWYKNESDVRNMLERAQNK